jgi:hypothetical protein
VCHQHVVLLLLVSHQRDRDPVIRH